MCINASNCLLWGELNRSKKETPHSFKGQQLEYKSLYRFVIYMCILETFLSYNLTLSFVTRDPRLAEIHNDLSESMQFQKLYFYNATQIDTTMRNNGMIGR